MKSDEPFKTATSKSPLSEGEGGGRGTTVQQADKLIKAQIRSYGTEYVPFEQSIGRVLAEDLAADRDMPAFNRVTMDGIAISYNDFQNGKREFHIAGTQAAGEPPIEISTAGQCVEIMTGAVLPNSVDTVIRYEDVEMNGSTALVLVDKIEQGQNLHLRGRDRKQGDFVATKGTLITPALINTIASIGKIQVSVNKQPRVVIISSGDELVEVDETPSPWQIRKSNSYTLKAVLQQYSLNPDLRHIPDEPQETQQSIAHCLEHYDVILLSGGVSMGKFDYIPRALEELSVAKIIHKVQQRPGKPFWFGASADGVLVFAFPGNPVATFMGAYRYFIPWLQASVGMKTKAPVYAMLNEDFTFTPELQYFLQVQLSYTTEGRLTATPLAGNGSGDFANLADTDAFMELPLEKITFKAGEVYRVWLFK